MSCNDIPSLLDLQKAKLNADDFGRLMGTGTGTSTNGVTGQVRPTYNKVINDMNSEFDGMISDMNSEFDTNILNMGFTRIGTFSAGATITNPRQTLLWDVADGGDGQEYGWSGSFPLSGKVVPPGSTPSSTGGIAVGAWMSRFDPELRIQVREALRRSYAEAGYLLIGDFSDTGLVVTAVTDVVLWEPTGVAYAWTGALPHTIAAAETPVGNASWTAKSAKQLRTDLTATSGANLVGTSSGASVQAVINRSISVSFIFDDAFSSTETVLKPLFDTYGAKFGIAVPFGSLGNPGRFTAQTLAQFAGKGYEVLNHATSGDVMSATTKGVGGVRAELATCWSGLSNLGIRATGFQTPSSLLHASYADVIAEFCDYAFVGAAATSPILPGTDPKKLFRFGIEPATLAQCQAVLDTLKLTQGAVVFYMHDVVSGDANYVKVQGILDKCAADGIDVLLPSECISRSVSPIGNAVKMHYTGEPVHNAEYNYSATGGATLAISPNKDITVTLPAAGEFLVQKTINFKQGIDVSDVINFSTAIRDLGGTATNCLVGIKLYSGVDGTGTELFASVEESAKPNTGYVRYFTQAVGLGAKSALIYHRLTTSAAGRVLLRSPTLRFGTSIEPEKNVPNVLTLYTATIPAQSIAATGAFTDVTLTDSPTNGLFRVTGNQIIFLRDAVVHIAASLVANGTNVAVGFKGGSCAVTIGGTTTEISPIGGGDHHLAGKASTTLTVTVGTAIMFKCLVGGVDFAIGAANSRLLVTEI